jgi:hypothetical protein
MAAGAALMRHFAASELIGKIFAAPAGMDFSIQAGAVFW